MAKPFENFQVYQLSIQLTKDVFSLMRLEVFDREFEFKNQIKRAVLSISNNIAEGSEYNNNAQFIRFLKYAKGSCAEVRNMLILSEYIFNVETKKLIEDSKNISIQLSKFIDYLKLDNKK